MPELPDIELYLHALKPRIVGHTLERIRVATPFLVRSFDPPIDHAHGKKVVALRRLGKRLVWHLEDDLFLIIHLMIAGRFKFTERGAKIPGKVGLAAFDFDSGSLILTEAGSQRRASLHLVRGEREVAAHGRSPLAAGLGLVIGKRIAGCSWDPDGPAGVAVGDGLDAGVVS